MSLKKTRFRFSDVAIVVPLWVAAVLCGATILLRYSFSGDLPTAVLKSHPAPDNPETSDATTDTGPHIYAFLHPRCPCSRATLIQLGRMADRQETVGKFQVLFFCPSNHPDTWAQQELWQLATSYSGLTCSIDRGGLRTSEFGVRTSGHILAFGADGRRLFSGGITSSRGHEGHCLGSQLLEKVCSGRQIAAVDLPVFGCEISRSVTPPDRRRS